MVSGAPSIDTIAFLCFFVGDSRVNIRLTLSTTTEIFEMLKVRCDGGQMTRLEG